MELEYGMIKIRFKECRSKQKLKTTKLQAADKQVNQCFIMHIMLYKEQTDFLR